MAGLVLEGGTLRPIFSCGVMDALLDNDVMFPYCIGVSAGITNCVSYISRQRERNLEIATRFRHDKRYIGAGNIRREKSLFGFDFIFGELANEILPIDYDTFRAYQGEFKIGVTNCITGEPEYMDGLKIGERCDELRATCSVPLLFPPVYINAIPYYDGGVADPIPIRKSISDGNEKNLIVLTQTEDYIKQTDRRTKFAISRMKKKYPEIARTLSVRYEKYNNIREFCKEQEKEGKAIIIYPEYQLDSMEKDVNKLKANYDMGYRIATEYMNEIKALLK